MKAGRLREKVQFKRLSGTKDAHGNVDQSWGDLDQPVWADVLEGAGREQIAAGRLEAPRTATVRVRSATLTRSVTAADAVFARDAWWDIRSVAAMGRKGEELEFLCEERVAP